MSGFFAPPASAAAGPAVLLVDDEVAILDGLRRQLRRNFTVHTATGGAEALQILEAEPITVVVSDMRMPRWTARPSSRGCVPTTPTSCASC